MTKRVHADGGLGPAGRSLAERMLSSLGADAAFVDAVLGDLAEEFSARAERDGVPAARLWYARESLRAAPHVLRSAVRHSPRARARVAMAAGALALAVTAGIVAVVTRDGPPARLIADDLVGGDGIVVNNVKPVALAIRVVDEAGHTLESGGVHYRRAAGAPITVTPAGVVTCTHHGDATVEASLGGITTAIEVWCRPVLQVRGNSWIDFVTGDPARPLPFEALGVDGAHITQLRGAASVMDTSVAKLVGATIAPRAAGRTGVDVTVGDRALHMSVLVHERVRTFDGLRADQRLVAMPVSLAQGDTVEWALPRGALWLKYLPSEAGAAPPTIMLDGPVSCSKGNGLRVFRVDRDVYAAYCYVGAGGRVRVAHGRMGAAIVTGMLALERVSP